MECKGMENNHKVVTVGVMEMIRDYVMIAFSRLILLMLNKWSFIFRSIWWWSGIMVLVGRCWGGTRKIHYL